MEGTIFQSLSEWLTVWIPIILQIVGAFAAIATLTPNKTDDRIVQWLLDIVNFLGANFGKAKNNNE